MTWFSILLLFSDPGWGITRSNIGDLYVGDVIRNIVWRIDKQEQVSKALQNRHSHSLGMNENQLLIGDQTDYDPNTKVFTRWAWQLEAGKLKRLPQVPASFKKPSSIPKQIPTAPGWDISGFTETAEHWWILEHIPMQEFEGIHTRKAPYLQVRKVEKQSNRSQIMLQVSQSAP
jgi:hypothetical protein